MAEKKEPDKIDVVIKFIVGICAMMFLLILVFIAIFDFQSFLEIMDKQVSEMKAWNLIILIIGANYMFKD